MRRFIILFLAVVASCSAMALENLAIGKNVFANSNTNEARYCVSTNKNLRAVGWRTGGKGELDKWLTVDLGEEMNVGAVLVRWIRFAKKYSISVSKDNVTYKDVAKADNINENAQGFGFPTERVRYVRITIEEGLEKFKYAVSLSQFEIYEF